MFSLFKKKKLKSIDKTALNDEIKNFKGKGIEENSKQIIISLTSFPARINEIHFTLYSLLNQSLKPNKVVLWLAKDQFENQELPNTVLDLQKNGLEVKWCENLYSYKKLIPALEEFPNSIIVTADDDIYYEKDWLKILYEEHLKYPYEIICHRAHKVKIKNKFILPYKKWSKKIKGGKNSSFLNFLTGAGGVLYPVGCLYKDVLDKNLFNELAPKGDDIWFWAMAILNNTKIRVPKNNIVQLTYVNPERERGLTGETTLFSSNKLGGNDKQLQKIIEYYPQILDKITDDNS